MAGLSPHSRPRWRGSRHSSRGENKKRKHLLCKLPCRRLGAIASFHHLPRSCRVRSRTQPIIALYAPELVVPDSTVPRWTRGSHCRPFQFNLPCLLLRIVSHATASTLEKLAGGEVRWHAAVAESEVEGRGVKRRERSGGCKDNGRAGAGDK